MFNSYEMPQSTFLVRNTHKETVKEQVLCWGVGGVTRESEIRIAMIQKKLGDFFCFFSRYEEKILPR